jgi:hypothetical protein
MAKRMGGGLNGPAEGPMTKQVKDYAKDQRAAYEPGSQDQAIGEFGGVGNYKPLNVKGKADTGKQNPGQGGGANYDNSEDMALESPDTQEGALSQWGGVAAGDHFASEEKSDVAGDVLGIGKGSDYGWNSDSPWFGGGKK